MSTAKQLTFIVSCAAGFGIVAYYAIGSFGHWYEQNIAKSEHDLGVAYVWFLVVFTTSIFVGGITGRWLYKRHISRHSNAVRRNS